MNITVTRAVIDQGPGRISNPGQPAAPAKIHQKLAGD